MISFARGFRHVSTQRLASRKDVRPGTLSMALPESPETTTLRCSLLAGFLPTHEEKPSQRMRYGDRLLPLPMADFANLGEVASANPKNNLFRGYLFRPRPGQKAPPLPPLRPANPSGGLPPGPRTCSHKGAVKGSPANHGSRSVFPFHP